MIEAVIFDWGGTLSEYVPVEMIDVWRLAARHLAPEREDELCARLVAVEEAFWASTATHQRSGRLADLLTEASRQLGLDVTDAVLEEAATHHLDAWTPHIRHDPEAVPTLDALRERGLRIGLLSNTHWPRTFHEHFLERDGLAGLIDIRLYTSELAYQKPHPSAFRAVLEALGVRDPSRAVFVGDRPWDDIVGAKQVGMRAVLRHNPMVEDHPAARPDAVVRRLGEVVAVVDGWGG